MPESYSKRKQGQNTTETYYYNPDNEVSYIDTQSFPVDADLDQRSFGGSRTPGYRAIRNRKGVIPTLSCSDSISRFTSRSVTYDEYEYGWFGKRLARRTTNNRILEWYSLPTDGSDLIDQVWSKLRRKVLDQDFNAPVFLAEAGKTVDMIAHTAKRLALAYSSFRKGRLIEVAAQLGIAPLKNGTRTRYLGSLDPKIIGNAWLEYKYGWMPLLMDIHGAAKHVAELPFKRQFPRFKASVSQDQMISTETSVSLQGRLQTNAKAWVLVSVNHTDAAVANRLGGLNPLYVAWELIPFSFVADWFINIGDCIQELTAFQGVTILDSGHSYSSTFNGKFVANDGSQDRAVTKAYLRTYTRSPYLQSMPTLQVKSNPLSLSKIVTSAALLRQLVH